MKQVIKRWDNSRVIYEGDHETLRAAVEHYVKSGISLEYANLMGVDLRNANLMDADLRNANLMGADLSGADLRGVSLRGAILDFQIQEGLLQQIAALVLSNPELLQMENWHSDCGTTHCLAGWACELNPVAKELEKSHGTSFSGLLTLGAEAYSYFHGDNETVLEYLESVSQ